MRLRLALASILVYACVCTAQSTPAIFEFHNGFWINLHHFLYEQAALDEQATVDTPPAPTSPFHRKIVREFGDRFGPKIKAAVLQR